MLDIKFIRSNPDLIKKAMKNRNANLDSMVDEVIEIDAERRNLMGEMESEKARQNDVSKKIPQMKKEGKDTTEIMKEMKTLSEKISSLRTKISELEEKQRQILLSIPNVPNESVPVGKDDSENVEVRRWGEPRKDEVLPHWEIGKKLGILDPETAAKITGTRFHVYKGMGARLERSVINFFLNTHTSKGYTEILPPFIVNSDSMTGTGQLPKFKEDAFKLENGDYYLVPTAEVPVTNMHRNEILDGTKLPIKYCAYTACFRAEAGSAGRDTRGLIRQHQFNKVELVKFVRPENSYDELEKLTADAENLLQLLKIPYNLLIDFL